MSAEAATHGTSSGRHITFEYLGHPGHVASAVSRPGTRLYLVRCSCGVEAEVTRSDLRKIRGGSIATGGHHA